jgi:hypothetical protein
VSGERVVVRVHDDENGPFAVFDEDRLMAGDGFPRMTGYPHLLSPDRGHDDRIIDPYGTVRIRPSAVASYTRNGGSWNATATADSITRATALPTGTPILKARAGHTSPVPTCLRRDPGAASDRLRK